MGERAYAGGGPGLNSMEHKAVSPLDTPREPARIAELRAFLLLVAALFLVRIGLNYLAMPAGLAAVATLLLSILFVVAPILALFRAARFAWTPGVAVGFVAGGVALHVLGAVVMRTFPPQALGSHIFDALAQSGLMLWCVGLGALLATLIRDRNLLVPVAIFLAGFDMFLIFSPNSLPQKILKQAPQIFQSVAAKVPAVVPAPGGGVQVGPGAFIGPADFILLGMFFIAIHKFRMRTDTTFRWVAPILVLYMLTVLYAGSLSLGPIQLGALPALVPIGLTVLLVNAREFRMTPAEKGMTAFVAAIALLLAGLGIVNAKRAQASQAGPSPQEAVPVSPESGGSPEPVGPGRSR